MSTHLYLKVAEKYNALKHEYKLKAHEVELIGARMQQNPHYKLTESVREMEAQLKQEQAAIEQLQKRMDEAEARHKELTQHEQDFKGRRDDRLKSLEVSQTRMHYVVREFSARQLGASPYEDAYAGRLI